MSRHEEIHFNSIDVYDEATHFGFVETAAPTNTTGDMLASSTELSDSQEIALILLTICSATLSFIGSSVIVFKITRSLYQKKSSTPYDRIILGLSSCDILASLTYAISPFLLPRKTSTRVWAFGNNTTCTWIGFLVQLAIFWAIWYNCVLSFYYLLTVRFQVKRKEFTQKYELWMHLPGMIFFPLTSVTGLVGNWYSEMRYNMLCWIGEVPKGCQGCWGVLVAYMFGAPSTIITLLAVVINNFVIYLFVRKNLLSSSPPATTGNSDAEEPDIETSSAFSLSPQRVSKQQRLRKEAAIQGFLYVTTFLFTFLPSFAIQVIEGMVAYGDENLQQIYPLLVMNAMLLPLQGFFNVFIYVRPSYNRFRAANPDKAMTTILKQALFDPNIPRISTANNSGSNFSNEQQRATDKYSSMRGKSGSNFSASLDKILEHGEDGSMEEKEEPKLQIDASSTKPGSMESLNIHR